MVSVSRNGRVPKTPGAVTSRVSSLTQSLKCSKHGSQTTDMGIGPLEALRPLRVTLPGTQELLTCPPVVVPVPA
jgi:hypothetical protein